MFEKMKQLMDMRKMAQEAERRLGETRVEKSALGGKLRIVVDGNHRVESLFIDDSLLNPAQKTVVEKALAALLTETAEAVKREAASKAMEMMKGMKLPGM
ncbi:MAG: YbaB/EbfC family nucleoid-associated protein [Elusimicrobia bacterium]|nr:YbaB/EbfC family nucleoid-associated protein [Elusimicrobiota bacterium]